MVVCSDVDVNLDHVGSARFFHSNVIILLYYKCVDLWGNTLRLCKNIFSSKLIPLVFASIDNF